MPITSYELRELDWDTRFFETKMGEVMVFPPGSGPLHFSEVTWRRTLELAQKQEYRFLFCQFDVRYQQIANYLFVSGAMIGDILVTFGLNLAETSGQPQRKPHNQIFLADYDDLPGILAIAADSFHDSRFVQDPNFDRRKAAQFYPSWLSESFLTAEVVFVIKENHEISGFISLKVDFASETLIIRLIATKESARGLGLGQALVDRATDFAREQKLNRIQVGTQITNLAAIHLYEKKGFRLLDAKYRFHIWLNSQTKARQVKLGEGSL